MTKGRPRKRVEAASEGSLLADFAERSSEDALAELIRRYQDLVYSTCLRVLGDAHAAEDAAQATFLVLVRKARSLRREGSLMGWLFRTAELVARNVRRARARAARRESEAVAMRKGVENGGASWEDVRPELDAALVSLPRAQCDAVVMHYMGHMSHEEIARQLGCPRTTISARISGGLARLREKLARRGVSLPAAALGGMLGGHAVAAAPAGLAAAVKAACLGHAVASSTAAAAAKGTVSAMAWAKAKVVTLVMACAAAAGAGGTVAARGLAPGIVAAPAPGGPVVLGEESYLRCRVIQMTDRVRRKDGKIDTCRVEKVSKSQVRLKPVPAGKEVVLPPLPKGDWTSPEFDDASWMRVRGKMGFLNARTGLVLVRGRFRLQKPADLRLNLRFQGGAVVYVNGREVARSNLPDGKITPQTLATDYPKEAYVHDEGRDKGRLLTHHSFHLHHSAKEFEQRVRKIEGAAVPASALKAGVNVVAVEIHRAPGAEFMYRARSGSQWARTGFDGLEVTAPPGSAVPAAPGRPKGLQVWNAGVTETVRSTDFGDPSEDLRPVRITGPRNGAFSAKVVAGSPEPVRGLEVKVSDLAGPGGKIPASAVRIRYGVEAPPMNNYIRYPEPFGALEENPPAEVKVGGDARGRPVKGAGAVVPVWFTVKVPRGTKPGLYKGKAAISAPGIAAIDVPIEAAVVGWTLPDPSEFYSIVGCFQSPESVAAYYGVQMWSDKHWGLIEKSLGLMGEMGGKTLYITAQRQTHLGNEHSMIRWEKLPDGKLKPDLSIAEKYVALAVKHMGKIPIVCLYCWEQNAPNASNNPSHLNAEQRRQYEREVLITVRDPKTGELSEAKGPEWGTPESREFWKPVFDGLKSILAEHGMADSLMLGIAGDYKPTERSLGDMKEVTGGAKWVLHSHTIRHMLGEKANYPVGYIAAAWGGHAWHNDPSEKRGYGWKMPFPRVMTRGFDRNAACQRTMMEFLVTGIAKPKRGYTYGPGYGLRGVGRCGADFWSVLKSGENRRSLTLFGRYPPTNWGQLNPILWCSALFAPGKDGAVATVRSELVRENQQEIEARAFIEKALTDAGKRGKLGAELAERAQALLDARTRLFLPRDSSLIRSGCPERMGADLYRLAAEVAAKLGVD